MSEILTLRQRATLVEALSSSLEHGGAALGTVPKALQRLLEDDAWREFTTSRGEHVEYDRFSDFVITPPLRGLGATDELIDRIAEPSKYPDLVRRLREARKVGRGHKRQKDSFVLHTGNADYQAERLAREAPEEYEAVERGERTIHAAAVRAGIRRRRIPVRLDNAESAARTLRDHMPPDIRRELGRLLLEED